MMYQPERKYDFAFIMLCAVFVGFISFMWGMDRQADINEANLHDRIICAGEFANQTYCHNKLNFNQGE